MGSNFAHELASGIMPMSLEDQIGIHLRSNHYPPVPHSMVRPCVEAIRAYNDGRPEDVISLPDGVSWRGQSEAPAYDIIDAHHLAAWLEDVE